MLRDISFQSLFMGFLTAFVGFASSFAVILHGLSAVGATEAEAASGLMALSVSMGVLAILLSVWTRLPISIAWSTPGAALLITAGPVEGGYAAALGAFLFAAVLTVVAGLIHAADATLNQDPAYRDELARWSHRDRTALSPSGESWSP